MPRIGRRILFYTIMKSKKDLALQIQRIHKAHCHHRLYNLAQSLVIRYTYNMSMTERNISLWRKYMQCHYPSGRIRPEMEYKAAHYMELMYTMKYSKEIFAK